jgi:hypothetical protein
LEAYKCWYFLGGGRQSFPNQLPHIQKQWVKHFIKIIMPGAQYYFQKRNDAGCSSTP